MRILVCGGREFDQRGLLYNTLSEIADEGTCTIISGMARGADTLAVDWAILNNSNVDKYPADWTKYGRKAGPIRNQQMLDEGKPDLVIAFKGGHGTNDMVKRARKAGIKVRTIDW